RRRGLPFPPLTPLAMPHRKMTEQADNSRRKPSGFGSAQALGLMLAMLIAQGLPGAELQSRTVASWENYIRLTERRVEAELGDGQRFLAEDFLATGKPQEA